MNYSSSEESSVVQEQIALYGKDSQLSFIVDAQLPQRLSEYLKLRGHLSVHTLELPNGNLTSDKFIKSKAVSDNLVLVTKDDDFLYSFIIEKKPKKLILVKTGNISNKDLLAIFSNNLDKIVSLLRNHSLIEVTTNEITAQK